MTEYFDSRTVNPKPDWYAAAVKAFNEYCTTDVSLDEWLTAWQAAVISERAMAASIKVDLDRLAAVVKHLARVPHATNCASIRDEGGCITVVARNCSCGLYAAKDILHAILIQQ